MATKITKIPSKAMQKRIMKAGEVSDADVELYIKQVGMETLQSMSLDPENVKEYLKNITELGNTQPKKKKKLPSKEKIEEFDSIIVADREDKISKIEVKKSKAKGKEKTSKDEDESGLEPSEKMTFKSVSKKATQGALDLGSAAFNKMFPNVGKFMGWVQNKIDKQAKSATESNSSVQSYSREVQKSSTILENIVESQNRANSTLQKIVDVVAAGNRRAAPRAATQPPPGGTGGNQPPGSGTAGTTGGAGSNLVRNTAIGAGTAGLAVGAGAAILATSSTSPSVEAPAAAVPEPAAVVAAPLTPAAAPMTAATPSEPRAVLAAAAPSGPRATLIAATATPSGPRAALTAAAAPPTPPAAAATPAGPGTELTPRQQRMASYYLTSRKLEDDPVAKELVENIVRQIRPSGQQSIDEAILDGNYTSIRIRQSPIGMLISHQPVIPGQLLTPNQLTAIRTGIVMNGRQHYPTVVLEQYDRQERGDTSATAPTTAPAAAATPVPAAPAAAPATATAITPAETPAAAVAQIQQAIAEQQTVARRPDVGQLEQQADQSRREAFLQSYRTRIQDIILQNLEKTKDTPNPFAAQFAARAMDLMNEGKLDEALDAANRMLPQRSTEQYTVKRGDTLTSIARSFGISVQELMSANNITNRNAIRIGLTLNIPRRMATQIEPTTPTPTAPAAVAEPPSVSAPAVPAAVDEPVALPVPPTVVAPAAAAATQVVTPTATGFDARLLHIKAREIVFKADKFDYLQDSTAVATAVGPGPGVSGGSSSPSPASPVPSAGGDTSGGGSASVTPGGSAAAATQEGAANLSGLEFGRNIDQRIKSGIADKTREVQSAFGRKLLISSGYRDPVRNASVGGAKTSKHLTGDAVDVKFQGNEQDTINLIKTASAKGIGGIGVYRPGEVHLDTGAKRVWGPSFGPESIPQWAKPALDEHMSGRPAAGGAQAAAGLEGAGAMPSASQTATLAGTSTATPAPAAPSSGAAVSRASTADEASSRMIPPAPAPTPTTGGGSPSSPAQSSPGMPAIDPNNPGDVEPPDAAQRYARLFNMAA